MTSYDQYYYVGNDKYCGMIKMSFTDINGYKQPYLCGIMKYYRDYYRIICYDKYIIVEDTESTVKWFSDWDGIDYDESRITLAMREYKKNNEGFSPPCNLCKNESCTAAIQSLVCYDCARRIFFDMYKYIGRHHCKDGEEIT